MEPQHPSTGKSVQTIAVLSDIHGNADALAAAVAEMDLSSPDLIIILGDLLTYGVQPHAVLDAVDRLAARGNCVFISGNHDQFYFDLDRGAPDFYASIPEFVLESVRWTHDQLSDAPALADRYPWQARHALDDILFSHANPYDYGDWSYVSKPDQWADAAETLRAQGFRIGIFGHSHRAFAVSVDPQGAATPVELNQWFTPKPDNVLIANPGTIGQPRGTGFSYLMIYRDGPKIRFDLPKIDFDRAKFCKAIENADLSAGTREKLVSFMEK